MEIIPSPQIAYVKIKVCTAVDEQRRETSLVQNLKAEVSDMSLVLLPKLPREHSGVSSPRYGSNSF